MTKGIILAGGSGTRLYPLTRVVSKQLLPVYDKPMIYYPLSDADAGGHPRDPDHLDARATCRGSASCSATARSGASSFAYAEQAEPDGLAQAFVIGREFVGDDAGRPGPGRQHLLRRRPQRAAPAGAARSTTGATVFGYHVKDPERYGVVEFDATGRVIGLEEKPAQPEVELRRHGPLLLRQPGARHRPRPEALARGESRSPTSTSSTCGAGSCAWRCFGRGIAWLDTGTHESLHAGVELHPDHRAAAGPEGRLPGGDRLPDGLHRRRAGRAARRPALQERVRPVPAGASLEEGVVP